MASNPPGKCCCALTPHSGEPKGSLSETYGVNAYTTGPVASGKPVIMIASDIYGCDLTNTHLVADQLSALTGYPVLIPDLFEGDPCIAGTKDLPTWLNKHLPDRTLPIFKKFVDAYKAEYHPSYVVGIGYCYGAKLIINELTTDGLVDVGCFAHPSFIDIAEVKKVAKPLLISAATDDHIFTSVLRHETEDVLVAVGATFQIDLFSSVSHGYSCRGDLTVEAVRYAANKTIEDQVCWIKRFAPSK